MSKPGHHQTTIQTLSLTVGIEQPRIIVLDALRRSRNLSDYSGDLISDAAVSECIASAEALLHDVNAWLRATRPDL